MTNTAKLSKKSRGMLEHFKQDARKRILKREFVQFRVDEQMMDLLLRVAEYKQEPMGVMVRNWVAQKLAEEAGVLPLPKVKLSDGRLLSKRSAQRDVERALLDHQNGRIKLSEKEYRTLMDWLLDRHLANKYARA